MSSTPRILLALSLIGCGDNTLVPDAGPADADDSDAMVNPFTTLATFDPAMMEQPEGVAIANGVTYVGLASLGRIVKIQTPGTVEAFGTLPPPVANTYTLGLAVDANGDVLVAVGASGVNPMPPPGIYKIPAAGGMAEAFSSVNGMNFPNAIDLDAARGRIYVTDSAGGRIYEISPATGNATVWLDNPMLDGDTLACNGTGATFAIGANGIAHDASNRYVAVTDFGRIVRIPILGNGNAGTPEVLAESCANLQGIDGIALEAGGTIVAVRNGPSNTMVRVSADGQTVTPIHVGAPLDGPASVTIEADATPRLILTNSAFFSGTSGKPSVLARDL